MLIREMLEQRERDTLSPDAAFSAQARRARPEPECDMRTAFQRDRDRILHSKSFRRLKHKTQVFLSPEGDHYRTRLTHTLEVAQIGRTIARALRLNEDLVEAAALGHDLGHTPFGHAGERALRSVCPLGYSHNEQSVRIATALEKTGRGLNLTNEVLDAMLCHSGSFNARTLEGQIVRIADKIAYVNHDVDDAIRGGILTNDDQPFDIRAVLGSNSRIRINTMVSAVIEASGGGMVDMDPIVREATYALRQFMFDHVYHGTAAQREEKRAKSMLRSLYEYFIEHPDELPDDYFVLQARGEALERIACDYVAGMTDRYSISTYKKLFIPKSWNKIED